MMEQSQIHVKVPLGTKLIFITVALLLLIIGFLGISSISLLSRDKLAYTYEAQSTQASLIGRSVRGEVTQAIDALRLSLASATGGDSRATLQSVVDNQTAVQALWVGEVDLAEKALRNPVRIVRAAVEGEGAAAELPAEIAPEALASMMPDLLKDGFALAPLDPKRPTPYVLLAFTGTAPDPGKPRFEIAIGLLNLAGAVSDVRGNEYFVATRSGRPLLSSLDAFAAPERDPLFATAAKTSLKSGALEYSEADGTRYLGSYAGPGFGLVVGTKVAWKRAMQSLFGLVERFILLAMMAIGAGAILAILFARTLTAPIRQLYDGTMQISEGHFDVHLPVKGRDEMGALSNSFNLMSSKINALLEEGKEKVKLENELAIASTVQQTLLPADEFRSSELTISGYYESASQCGGDWWGHFEVGGQHCIMIADATGHGLPSALITASARSCFSVMQKLAEEDRSFSFSPSAMLKYANRVIHDSAGGQIMMTFFVGVFDFASGKFRYSSAGHNPPWFFHKKGGSYAVKSLTAKGTRLGETSELSDIEEKEVAYAPGDFFFLYTDGVTEGQNRAGEQFGKKRVRKLVEELADRDPRDIITHLMNEFHLHNEGKPFDDDVTIAIAKIGEAGGPRGV